MDNHHHLTTTTLLSRLVFIVLIGVISIWANHEASKGFAITIVNNSGDSLAGRRFSLFYESNDEANRRILLASKIVENIITYSNNTHPKTKINHIILRLASRNLADMVMVNSGENSHEFVIDLCPSIIQGTNYREATPLAILRGVARVWLWDGPPEIVDATLEYIVDTTTLDSGADCLKSVEKAAAVSMGRLNGGDRKDGWDDGVKLPGQNLCGSQIFYV